MATCIHPTRSFFPDFPGEMATFNQLAFCSSAKANLEMVTFNYQDFFCHFALSENKAGTVTAEGILIFAVVKWSVVALNQQCLSVLILQMTTFNQYRISAGWEL